MSVRNKFSLNVGTGAPLLLTIFLVLSLISFSVLSFMTSRADYRFAQSLGETTTAFYIASNESERKVSEIRITLRGIYDELATDSEPTGNEVGTSDEPTNIEELFLAQAKEALREYDINEEHLLTFTTTINDNQDLIVSLQLIAPTLSNDDFFVITSWQVIQTGEWAPDNTLNLL
jgi:hypothetical protein